MLVLARADRELRQAKEHIEDAIVRPAQGSYVVGTAYHVRHSLHGQWSGFGQSGGLW